jgi:hypothetical protein
MLCHILGMSENGVAEHSCITQESVVPHTEFKGSPESATWNVLYHTSLRIYASFSLQVPSILSILLGVAPHALYGEGGCGVTHLV